MEYEKKYVSVNELAEYLKVNKKIIIKENQEMVFNKRSYQSLINPYKDAYYENIKVDENSYTTKIIRILLLIKDQLNK